MGEGVAWGCSSCGTVNAADISRCTRCETPRPDDAGFLSQLPPPPGGDQTLTSLPTMASAAGPTTQSHASAAASHQDGSPAAVSPSPRWRTPTLVAAVVVLALVAAAGAWYLAKPSPKPNSVTVGLRSTTTAARVEPSPTGSDATTSAPASTSTSTSADAAVPPIRGADLRTISYRVNCPNGPATLDPAANRTGDVAVDLFEPIFGDVTGDGSDDAVIQISCIFADGGNASTSSVVVAESTAAGLRQVGEPIDGFDPVVAGGRLTASQAVYGNDDPRCCPSTIRYVPFTLAGTAWTEGGGGSPLRVSDAVTTVGMGSVRTGDTYAQVAAATGRPVAVVEDFESNGGCTSVALEGAPDGVTAIGGDGRLHVIYVENAGVRTRSGLGIGSTAAAVYQAYPGRMSAAPHEYVEGGEYLTFSPADDRDHRVVFDTDGSRVTLLRTGETDWANLVEGCL